MIQIRRLKNGARVVLEPMPYLRSAAVGIWVLAGSRDECSKKSGISHFTEHMLFKGTKTRTASDIAEEMDGVGGQINAYTSKELTCYYARVLDEHLDKAMDVLADMFFNSMFDEEEIVKERNVILEEINMYEDTPEDLAHDILQQAVWKESSLGRSILGDKETVSSFSGNDFKEFTKEFYRPDKVVISIAGKFDEEAVMEMCDGYFGGFDVDINATPEPALNLIQGQARGRLQAQKHIKTQKDDYSPAIVTRDKDVEQLHLCVAFPGIPLGSEDVYTLAALNTMFGGGMSSRLFQNIREKHGLVYSIYSYAASYRNAGAYIIYAALNPGSARKAASLIMGEVERLFSDRFTEDNLKKTREQLKSNYMLSLESTSSRMSSNARSELLLDRILTTDELLAKIESITLDGLYELAESIFDREMLSLSAVGRMAQTDMDGIIGQVKK